MPAGFYTADPEKPKFKRFFLYGPPKAVKTPLALAYGAYLRSLNPKSKTIYIAADPGSEDLPSIPNPEWRNWIVPYTFGSPLEKEYDPYKDAIQASMLDWHKHEPDSELLIWDTFAFSMEQILQYVADKEFFAPQKGESKHVTFGDPTLPKGHPARLNIPVMGDFNGINGIAKRLLAMLIAQPMHVLIITHEQDIKDEKGIKRIGPSFVGQALTSKLPGWMTGLIYTDKRGEIDPKTGKVVPALYVCSDPHDDVHIAGIRHEPVNGDPRNPIGTVKVGTDLVKYWELFHNTLFPNEAPSLSQGGK